MRFPSSYRFFSCRWLSSLLVALAPLCTAASAAAVDAPATVDPYSAWWTGSLLSAHGHTTPAGHSVVEPYLIYAEPLKDSPTRSVVALIVATTGLTDTLDLQLQVQDVFQAQGGESSNQIGDTTVRLAFQMLEDRHDGGWVPDLNFFARQIFPTGRYEQLDPKLNGTDASGRGAYTTSFGVNVQKVFLPSTLHQLRLRLNLSSQFPSAVAVRGLSSYGGSPDTAGDVYPGKSVSATVAAEYHLTQSWVAALDLGYNHGGSDAFVDGTGSAADSPAVAVGGPGRDRFTFAPAVEYNFNGNVGIVSGASVDVGRNVTTTISPMIAVNVYQ